MAQGRVEDRDMASGQGARRRWVRIAALLCGVAVVAACQPTNELAPAPPKDPYAYLG
jgi:hypothetical protein